jgi:hypothetical protein
MNASNEIFGMVYVLCVAAIFVYGLRMLGRLVSALEKMAASLDIIARKLKDDAKP